MEQQNINQSIKYCGKCGNPIPSNAQYCPICMQKASQTTGYNGYVPNAMSYEQLEMQIQEKNIKCKIILSIVGIVAMFVSYWLSIYYYEDYIMLIKPEGILMEFGLIFFVWKLFENINKLKLFKAKLLS